MDIHSRRFGRLYAVFTFDIYEWRQSYRIKWAAAHFTHWADFVYHHRQTI